MIPNSSRRSSSRFSTCACTETSSADTGSSATMRAGRVTSARAMAMRWRWPPENSCGYLPVSDALRPTASSASTTRSRLSERPTRSSASGSATIRATFCLGSSEPNGSWNTI